MGETLKIGGVDENINAPWRRALGEDRFATAGIEVSWKDFGGGTGAMMRALDSGEIDVAVALIEGSITHAARTGTVRLFGLYTETPLVWGVHVHADSKWAALDELSDARFAISRPGSGSQIMVFVEAQRHGWRIGPKTFVEVGNLDGAIAALGSGEADAFMWEKYTTKPVVDRGEWRRIDEVVTPWPGFVFVARPEVLESRGADIRRVVEIVRHASEELAADTERTATFVARTFSLERDDVLQWIPENAWNASIGIPEDTITAVQEILIASGVLEDKTPYEDLVLTAF